MSTTKSPWGTIGAWAAEAEREEAEELAKAAAAPPPPPPPQTTTTSFPTLKESNSSKPTTKGKKTKMSLHEFTMSQSPVPPRGLPPHELLRLPTRPMDRNPDDYDPRGGGTRGFNSYGSGQRSYDDNTDRRGSRVSEYEPSRADGVDNWASTKKFTPPDYHSRPEGRGIVSSRADGVDNWVSVKKPVAAVLPHQQQQVVRAVTRPETEERWTRNDVATKVNRTNPFGAARPREEVLAEKGLDWKKIDEEIEEKSKVSSRPGSSQSITRPGSAQSSGEGEVVVVVKEKVKKVNPFGDAKPREVLLEEKGLDWKKIDLNLEQRRVDRLLVS